MHSRMLDRYLQLLRLDLDHTRLTCRSLDRQQLLTDVYGCVVNEIPG